MQRGIVRREPYVLDYVPDHLRTHDMCNEVMCNNSGTFLLISDRFKTQVVSIKAVEVDPWSLGDVPDHFKPKKCVIRQ